ncbi:DUF3592 domain-containing protein [Hymenobacter endophyticus]|uniref:DUF3592 domain-containing protein n=1 Tax=Hymenobacter endophyticus TaxID=3076335 RepID=A0ABU3TFW2_9BACT|nr:DUF3592 domain-containing protein [Hymenobacter endophyticus]MDU0370238.1 DUF3592 domain-containing protein [Hymenobacter endophyticus]
MHAQRQQQRRKRYTKQQQAAARARLPWVLVKIGLLVLLLLAGSGLLWYRASQPLASLARADGVVSWVEVRRSTARYRPYILKFATHPQDRIWEVYLGQSEELAAYYTAQLHVGDSVQVYYNEDAAKGSPLVYQLEKAGQVLLSAGSVQSENKVGAVGFGLLGLLTLVLAWSSPPLRMAIKSYFRSSAT